MISTHTFCSCQMLLLENGVNGKGNGHSKNRQYSVQKGGETVNIVSGTDIYATGYEA